MDRQSHFTFSCDITIALEIKPGSFRNSLNPRNQGVIPVAILSTSTFDAANVEPGSLKFGPNLAAPRQFALEDVNNDGSLDNIKGPHGLAEVLHSQGNRI